MSERKRKPEAIGRIVANVLGERGLAERVEQAAIIPEWAKLVGPQIAAVSEPQSITADGTLFVHVSTNAWMTELSLLEPELLRSLNAKPGRAPVRRIRWLLRRDAGGGRRAAGDGRSE
jgi:predicted nucleic acid-binding Zn ribbon protein